jgi:hypothetical protein
MARLADGLALTIEETPTELEDRDDRNLGKPRFMD